MCPYKLGDVNHDAKVNIIDMHIIAKSFGMQRGDEHWNCHADIDENERIDIIGFYQAAREFGKDWTYP